MFRHEGLREGLAALELSCSAARPEDAKPVRREEVDDAAIEWQLRTNDGEIDAFALREREERVDIASADISDANATRDARVSGRGEDFGDAPFRGQFPDERVFAGAASDNEDSHVATEKRNLFRRLRTG